MTTRIGRARSATVALGALLLGGCGDLTSGGVGDLDVLVAVDSVEAAGLSGIGGQVPPESPALEGTLALSVQVFVLRPPSNWIEMTEGVQELLLPLQDPGPSVIASRELVAGKYRAVRTVFRRVEANVERGLVVDGQPVTGLVRVNLGDEPLVVESAIEVSVAPGETSSLEVDLHTSRWLRRLDRDLRQVRSQDFESELRLRPRM